MLIFKGDIQIVFPNRSASKYLTLSNASIDKAPENVYSLSFYSPSFCFKNFSLILVSASSLNKLFLINILVNGTPLSWNFLIIDSKLSSLMKLYFNPSDLILVEVLLNIPSEIAAIPFFLNQLNPISRCSSVLFFVRAFLIARAPSTSTLLLNKLKNFKWESVYNIWAIALAPDTPILLFEISID